MPMSESFQERLERQMPLLLETVATPFYVYDEAGIVAAHRRLVRAFGDYPVRQHFAVKALPNPAILQLLMREGSGFDCSSPVELALAAQAGATGTDIAFTPNNVDAAEYDGAIARGAYVTFDDRSALHGVHTPPHTVAFRVGPGDRLSNVLMGDRARSKFGVPRAELRAAYSEAAARGVSRFGIHSMVLTNELDASRSLQAAGELVQTAVDLCGSLGITFEYINFGGGVGIPYRPEDCPFDTEAYAEGICSLLERAFRGSRVPKIFLECGRCITGPYGTLVTRVVSRSQKASTNIGVDACMSALMRPAIYPSAYHHITSMGAPSRPAVIVDVVGAICENNDKLGIDRSLPDPRIGDVLLVHDGGAHGHAAGFNYNGRLRPAEILLPDSGAPVLIRRAETLRDYTATILRQPLALQSVMEN